MLYVRCLCRLFNKQKKKTSSSYSGLFGLHREKKLKTFFVCCATPLHFSFSTDFEDLFDDDDIQWWRGRIVLISPLYKMFIFVHLSVFSTSLSLQFIKLLCNTKSFLCQMFPHFKNPRHSKSKVGIMINVFLPRLKSVSSSDCRFLHIPEHL